MSRPKAQKIFESLRKRGVSPEQLNRVRAPTGLEIGAVSPEEIAVSTLAETVQVGRSKTAPTSKIALPTLARIRSAVWWWIRRGKYESPYHGSVIDFCCAHCEEAFDREPGKYAGALR